MNNATNFAASTIKADAAIIQTLTALADEGILSPVEAVTVAIAACPDASRIGVKHAAILCGINARTARNTFDKVRAAKAAATVH